MSEPRTPVDATIDTVQGALEYLWNWLGRAPSAELAKREPEPERDQRIPPIVIDTEGEDR